MNFLPRYIFLFFFVMAKLGFSYYNERKYEGMEEYRKGNNDIQKRLEIIDAYLPENPVVFEAGAYNGEDSIRMADMWPDGQIISFEPNPSAFELYQDKTRGYKNVDGHNLAVNTYNGTTTFYLCWGTGGKDPIFEGASSVLPASEHMKIHYMGPQIEVPCVLFDDWCEEQKISQIDFMWLDLEGFELQFLNSCPKVLEAVKVIYAETNLFKFRKGTTLYSSLVEFLRLRGFVMVAHWFNEGFQGDAVFVRRELLR